MKYPFYILFFVLFSLELGAQTTLTYNLSEGDIFTIKQEATQIITQELEGASHELINTVNGILEFKVRSGNDSLYTIDLTFKDLNLLMTSSIQGELMNINAKEIDSTNMQSLMFNSLLNRPVQMVLQKTGAIPEVSGGDSLVLKMADASGLEDEFSLNMMKKSLEKEFGSEALSSSYEQMTFIYPENEVKIGDQWENEYSGKLNSKNTWTLQELTSENALIKGSADVAMDISEMATTMKLSGSQETQITTDLVSGFIQKMTVKGFSTGTSTMTQMGNQKIPTTIQSTTTYELIDNLTQPINN